MNRDDHMDEEEKKRSTARRISFSDLAADTLNFKPKEEIVRKKVSYDDPYFRMLDAGHALLIEKKRAGDLIGSLPKDLGQILLELESILKDMTLSAMEDDFDYHTQLNRYYFHMMRVNRLSSVLSFKMSRFLKNRGAVEKYFAAESKSGYQNFVNRLNRFVSVSDELILSSNLFMDSLERDNSLPEELRSKRVLSNEKTLEMIHS